jgi:hypothetical protein
MIRRLLRTSLILGISALMLAPPARALDDATYDQFAENNIILYDPQSGLCAITGSTISPESSGYDRLKEAVRAYGEYAMEMQREYGTPWEVVLAQMQKESSTGTAGIAVSGADNNWLGITGDGDAGSWISSSGRKWAKYSSVEASIKDWAGPRVLRNGYYDDAFSSLTPGSYNLPEFMTKMLSHYAPGSDGNNESAYREDVLSFIDGPIKSVREEKGWPSSSELAQTESIPIGGRHPLGGDVSDSSDTSNSSGSCSNFSSGDINQTAILLSWPDSSHGLDDPKPEYRAALERVGLNHYGDTQVNRGSSCDAFVSTVYRITVDPDFMCCGTSRQLTWLRNNPNYTEVPNQSNTSNMQPGDIMILDGHIMMYVKLEDGTERIASASYGDRTGDHAGNLYYSDSRGSYHIFRWTGGGKS